MENGLTKSILDCCDEIHPDLRNYFYENIVLAGGNTLFPNFKARL